MLGTRCSFYTVDELHTKETVPNSSVQHDAKRYASEGSVVNLKRLITVRPNEKIKGSTFLRVRDTPSVVARTTIEAGKTEIDAESSAHHIAICQSSPMKPSRIDQVCSGITDYITLKTPLDRQNDCTFSLNYPETYGRKSALV